VEIKTLEDIVLSEAREEAKKLTDKVSNEIEEYIKSETKKFLSEYNENIERIDTEFSSKKSYTEFSIESTHKKNILHIKHSLIISLKEELLNKLKQEIQKDPVKFTKNILNNTKINNGNFFISKDLNDVVTSEVFQKSINISTQSLLKYSGIDNELESGIAIKKDKIKYIFPLSEIVERFIADNIKEINEKLF
jgi:hypothetical protein